MNQQPTALLSYGHQVAAAKNQFKKKEVLDVAAVIVRFANEVPDLLKICAATEAVHRERPVSKCVEALQHFVAALANIKKVSKDDAALHWHFFLRHNLSFPTCTTFTPSQLVALHGQEHSMSSMS